MKQPSILDTRIMPPQGLVKKFCFYKNRYGLIHTILSYIGRIYLPIWSYTGAFATRRFLKRSISGKEPVLNLGGGGNTNTKFVTADIDPRADIYTDLTKPLPFPSRSIGQIFLEEVFEHFELQTGEKLLSECFRVLRDGGVIRLTTPDLEYFSIKVIESERGDAINEVFYAHGHRHIYTKNELREAVQNAGFVNIVFTQYMDSKARLGHLDSHAHRFNHLPEISMYLEAEKPVVRPV